MALTDEQRQQISSNIKRLDYLNGTGILSDKKKEMVKELFLIISAGGIGGKALREIKNTVMQQIDPNAVEKQIMFICADTCYSDLDALVAGGVFKEEEILKIPFDNALSVIAPNKMSSTTEQWVHPGLFDRTNGRPGYFDGSGASALRQCGRVMFAQSETQNRLFRKLNAIKKKVAAMNADGIADIRLKVFFLAGISGGTGSGTIIDLGFLTRFYLKQILTGMESRINYSAYIFLPSACGDPGSQLDQANGNKNAYAALKEIDYFMNLKSLGESFKMDYGTPETRNMIIEDNLFDFCTLVEGVGGGGVFFGNPEDTARKITALSLMNILCANNAGTAKDSQGKEVFLADAFLSNQDTQVRTRLLAHSDKIWPREANYHYNIIGYAACVVPVNLLTVYAFKKVFDVIYSEFKRHAQANRQMAESFLQQCGLDFRTVDRNYKNLTKNQIANSIASVSARLFQQYGPWFMINLTDEAAGIISDPRSGYIAQAQSRFNAPLANKNKWNSIGSLYNFVLQQLLEKNNSLYDVYTFVIEEMGKLLADNAGILTQSKELRSRFGSSFYWTPIDLTKGDNATKAVADYLDDIMNQQRTNLLAGEFVKEMYEKQNQWTSITPREGRGTIDFDAAKEIRDFIQEKMQDLVGKTLEDFIVMVYSGKVTATPSVEKNGKEVPSDATRDAAHAILSRLRTNAVPLASVKGDFNIHDCYQNVYLTIPEKCSWLYQAVVEHADHFDLDNRNIFKSSSNDSIVWSNLISGIPAWAISWTSRAEETYEEVPGPRAVGIHIEQGASGRDWAQLPNLYPEGLWSEDERKLRSREAAISEAVRKDMAEAKKKGLLIPAEDLYLLTKFNADETADSIWDSLKLVSNKTYEASEIYQMIRDSGKAVDTQPKCEGFEPSDNTVEAKDKKAFAYDMSCRLVRKNSRERRDLTRTLEISRELEKKLKAWNDSCVDLSSLQGFSDALKWGVLEYEGNMGEWTADLETETALGELLSTRFEQMCAHYFGYRQYLRLKEDILVQIKNAVEDKRKEVGKNVEFYTKQRKETEAFRESIYKFRTAKLSTDKPWDENSPFAISGNRSSWPMGKLEFDRQAEQLGYKADDIRTFYKNLEEIM